MVMLEVAVRGAHSSMSPHAQRVLGAMSTILVALLAFVASGSTLAVEPVRPGVRYVIPDGYVGWLRIDYGVSAAHAPGYGVAQAAALPRRDGMVIAEFPPTGHLVTSSELESGWAADQYFYGANGMLTPLSQAKGSNMVWNKFNGRLGGAASQTEMFFIGPEADYMKFGYRHDPVPRAGPVKR